MGWANGSSMAQNLWDQIRAHVKPSKREEVAQIIFQAFDSEDADDWDSCSKLCIDAGAYRNKEEEA